MHGSLTPPSPGSPARRRAPLAPLRLLLLLVLVLPLAGCPCARSAVNASPELRWWLFSNFGASRVCPELLKQGAPLRMGPQTSPVIGRFFPVGCRVDVDDGRQVMTLHFAGTGYAYTTMTRRIGFRATASIEYRPDFRLLEDEIYVWGKFHRVVAAPDFQLGMVEVPVADFATRFTPAGFLANLFANQIMAAELARGFTVVRTEQGDDFALEILEPPQRPYHPFQVRGNDRFTFANETVEVQAHQRDFLGPFEVPEGKVLILRLQLVGPPVDVMVVDKPIGDLWREQYQTRAQLTPPPGPVAGGGPLEPGPESERFIPLPPGIYYVVIDHSTAAGVVNPPASLWPAALSARVSYVAQLGD